MVCLITRCVTFTTLIYSVLIDCASNKTAHAFANAAEIIFCDISRARAWSFVALVFVLLTVSPTTELKIFNGTFPARNH